MEKTERGDEIMRLRLTVLFFLQFAVWGSYLTSMGGYLADIGLGENIGWFYSIQGIVSIFMPTIMGIIADKRIETQRLLGMSHTASAMFMFYVAYVGLTAETPSFASLFVPYTVAVAFYMPTLSLAASAAYTAMQQSGIDKVSEFPKIRIFGTVGFIVSMLAVDFVGIQHTAHQFIVCGIWGLMLGGYSLTMPHCPVKGGSDNDSLWKRMGLDAFGLFKDSRMLKFFIFSMLLGVSLQITNSYANPYISSFGNIEEYKSLFFVEHANLLISLSQVSETLCILLIPFFLKRYGIKAVMLIAMSAWFLRFGLFGIGTPAWPEVTFLVLSMIVYGVAFDFFNISGSLFVDSEVSPEMRSSAQGLFVLMTNGLGASIGTLAAQYVINELTQKPGMSPTEVMAGWQNSWLIFAAYAAVVGISFALIFRAKKEEKA